MMPEYKARYLANALLAEAEKEAPESPPESRPTLLEGAYIRASHCVSRQAFIIGYLTEGIVSLLMQHGKDDAEAEAPPKLVSDEMGEAVPFELDCVPFQVVARIVGADLPATRDCPEERRAVEVEAVYLLGYRLPNEIAAAVAEHYKDQINDQYIDMDNGWPCWAEDQSEGAA